MIVLSSSLLDASFGHFVICDNIYFAIMLRVFSLMMAMAEFISAKDLGAFGRDIGQSSGKPISSIFATFYEPFNIVEKIPATIKFSVTSSIDYVTSMILCQTNTTGSALSLNNTFKVLDLVLSKSSEY